MLYLSVPIGLERVEFNAHRIFDPLKLLKIANEVNLELKEFSYFVPGEGANSSVDFYDDMLEISKIENALGMFVFAKSNK